MKLHHTYSSEVFSTCLPLICFCFKLGLVGIGEGVDLNPSLAAVSSGINPTLLRRQASQTYVRLFHQYRLTVLSTSSVLFITVPCYFFFCSVSELVQLKL